MKKEYFYIIILLLISVCLNITILTDLQDFKKPIRWPLDQHFLDNQSITQNMVPKTPTLDIIKREDDRLFAYTQDTTQMQEFTLPEKDTRSAEEKMRTRDMVDGYAFSPTGAYLAVAQQQPWPMKIQIISTHDNEAKTIHVSSLPAHTKLFPTLHWSTDDTYLWYTTATNGNCGPDGSGEQEFSLHQITVASGEQITIANKKFPCTSWAEGSVQPIISLK